MHSRERERVVGFEGYSDTSAITSVRKPKSFLEKTERNRGTHKTKKRKPKTQKGIIPKNQKRERERETK